MRTAVGIVAGIFTILACAPPNSARAGDATEIHLAKEISRPGTLGIVTAAVVLPLVTEPELGPDRALRTVDAIGTAALVSTALKHLVDEPRLDGTGHESFPSNHATVAFAAATMAADYRPEQAPYWYSIAALIAYSRVRLNRHRVREVVAGAAIGYGIAKLEQELPRGLILAPLIDPDTGCNGVEVIWEF